MLWRALHGQRWLEVTAEAMDRTLEVHRRLAETSQHRHFRLPDLVIAATAEANGASRGGHIAVLDAVSAQLDPSLGSVLRPFDRMRRRRNQAEYPAADSPSLSAEDVERDLPTAQAIIETVVKVLDQMSPF